MLKVFIADDELHIREEIKNIINWNERGFIICGEGIDGEDTYEKICVLKPDLVLMDIKMHRKSGLDVLRDVKKKGFLGKFIIVSEYSEFNYVKEAMRYGAKSYLLKPIDKDELLDVVNEIKKEISYEKNLNINIQSRFQLIKEQVLSQLCLNNKSEEVKESLNSTNNKSLYIALISTDKNKFDNDNTIDLERCLKEKLFSKNTNIFKVRNRIAIMFYDKSIEYIYSLLRKIKIQIEEEMKENLFITIGEEFNNIFKINYSYESAKDLMKNRYLYLNEGIIYKDKIKNIINSPISEEQIINNLYSYIEIGEVYEIERSFLLLETLIIEKNYKEEQIKALLTTYYIKLKDDIISNYDVKESLDMDNRITIEEIYSRNSLHEVIKYLIDKFLIISKHVASNLKGKGIRRIVKYVDNKYYRDLKLEDLAEIFNYNSSYLGKLFKDTTGKSFNTYLDHVRIEQAKKLIIEDKLKVYEICEKVGYKNIDYFYYKFKKYVGTSPLNYKKLSNYKNA
ncbi:response regulator [Clostridium sp. AL.422]|uniref:response regulator transcription factor n=1 Tax=Clostridium TaxID=1485 RepID=UPI00293DA88B|nr:MULTISPECIES: response regulator [unclassified Clostridium]MDV4151166.1 response regulator [Clostridium sp. AL.422]